MTRNYPKSPSRLLLLGILLVVLCGVYHNNALAEHTLDHVALSSDPAVGTLYKGERDIEANTTRIVTEKWDPNKPPPLITYTISAYAKGPGKVTFYLGTGSDSQNVGS